MPLTFKHHQLKNGLDIIAEINPDSHSVAAGMFVKTGARDESMDVNGVSHFLEHMMFKGSDKYTWEDVNRIFDEIGARWELLSAVLPRTLSVELAVECGQWWLQETARDHTALSPEGLDVFVVLSDRAMPGRDEVARSHVSG